MASISLQQAQKLILLSQRLPFIKPTARAITATLSAIEHLGYIQIDTISAVQRAHHHTLWNRNPRYKNNHLEQLLADKKVFEYWSHAAAYLPICDYRYSLPRKRAIAEGHLTHWFERDLALMNSVLTRIHDEGPLMAKDFEHTGKKTGAWSSKPTKRALENLFMQGELMIPRRVNFHKVYDLTERVLPKGINTELPSNDEYSRFQIISYFRANGLGHPAHICYLLKNRKSDISRVLLDMELTQEVIKVRVVDKDYFLLPESLALLNKKMPRSKIKILSPFDNLLIQRKRMQEFFNFDYLIECYVPKAKRQYGYFSLPILWAGKLVARMDCKADRKNSILHINHLALEPGFKNTDNFMHALYHEILSFLTFNECSHIQIHRTTPGHIKTELQSIINSDPS